MRTENRAYRFLVIWYGLYQLGHLIFNAGYFLFDLEFPPPPESGTWEGQVVPFLHALGAGDLILAFLSVVFAAGFLLRKPWAPWLGLVTLSASLFSVAVFTWGTAANGTWNSQVGEQLFLYIIYLPVIVLLFWTCALFHRACVKPKINGDISI
jgi:hypothetical protein